MMMTFKLGVNGAAHTQVVSEQKKNTEREIIFAVPTK